MTSRAALHARLARLERRARFSGQPRTFFHSIYRDVAPGPMIAAQSLRGRIERGPDEPESDFIARACNVLGPGMVLACYAPTSMLDFPILHGSQSA